MASPKYSFDTLTDVVGSLAAWRQSFEKAPDSFLKIAARGAGQFVHLAEGNDKAGPFAGAMADNRFALLEQLDAKAPLAAPTTTSPTIGRDQVKGVKATGPEFGPGGIG